ncbi:MAG: carboxynorspermidine decarboxylase [Clostridia bacterium]|nr:carboxynorspermidine decarboxylase [Clostridia bacterium]
MEFSLVPSPAYIVDEDLLTRNLEILAGVEERTGCRILLAQKAFSSYAFYPLISKYLSGTTSSGLFEARLAAEHFPGERHVYAPAYTDAEFDEVAALCDHIVFNSNAQKEKFAKRAAGRSLGLRINPEFSTQGGGIYDPCAPKSRLGITRENLSDECLDGVEGLHFHTLCEQGADAAAATVAAVEKKFGEFFAKIKWINLGGGHHITKPGYDVGLLERVIKGLRDKYGLDVYLEPGEAVALNAGFLKCTVLEIVQNGADIAILDASAECHMPDVLEMPYRPPLEGAGEIGEKAHTYRLSSRSCLAGDVIGDYSFDRPLKPGDTLMFSDMAIYTMVKNNTFNGMPLPTIVRKKGDDYDVLKTFGYEDFKRRL